MKRFVFKIAFLCSLPLFIAVFNFQVDPAMVFGAGYSYRQLGAFLDQGKNLIGPANMNLRRIKSAYLQDLDQAPQTLVLGSSRVLMIGKGDISEGTFFNAGVSNATIYDLIALYEAATQKGIPEKVIIGLDQWMLNSEFHEKRWMDNRKLVVDFVKDNEITHSVPSAWPLRRERLQELISARYFVESAQALINGTALAIEVGKEEPNDKTIIYPDGSRWRPDYIETIDSAAISQKAWDYTWSSKSEYFTAPDAALSALLYSFLEEVKEDGAEICLFIPPYNPLIIGHYQGNEASAGIWLAEEEIRKMARLLDIDVIGGTDGKTLNLKLMDFYDANHLKKSVLIETLASP